MAERVMGWEAGAWWQDVSGKTVIHAAWYWRPTENIDQAMMLLDKITEAVWQADLVIRSKTGGGYGGNRYGCQLARWGDKEMPITYYADTLPLAICLAAKKAVEKGVNREP